MRRFRKWIAVSVSRSADLVSPLGLQYTFGVSGVDATPMDHVTTMHQTSRISHILLSATAVLTACGGGAPVKPPDVPESLRVAAGERMTLELRGTGVQIYSCDATKADPERFEWVLTAPEAELKSLTGALVGRHYAGPTWEGTDRSTVVGEVVARDAGPDAGAIPWLLLKAKSSSGAGVFGNVSHIQRIATSGGKAPAAGCTAAQAHTTLRVPYQADYRFYSPAP